MIYGVKWVTGFNMDVWRISPNFVDYEKSHL